MMTSIEIIRLNPEDPLKRTVWRFSMVDFPKVRLWSYSEEVRSSSRARTWSIQLRYSSFPHDAYYGERLKTEPEVPQEVLEEALAYMRNQITFEKSKV